MQAMPEAIGPYRIDSLLGCGSHGQVFKAFDPRLSRWVAVKRLYDYQLLDLQQEARLLADLNHPNIVAVYDFVQLPNISALVMEFVPGETLAAYLRQHIKIDWLQALVICKQVALGLMAAHERQIIHGDLKAENLLFDGQGNLKIGDFGIASKDGQQKSKVFGSCYAVSPEQVEGKHPSKQSDMYALGLLLFTLLTGHHPFDKQDGESAMLQRMLVNACPQLDFCPAGVNALIQSLLVRNPEQRLISASDFVSQADNLLQIQHPTLCQSRFQSEIEPLLKTEVLPKRRLKQFFFVLLAIVLLLLVTSNTWWRWFQTPKYIFLLNPIVTHGQELPDIPLIRAAVFQGLSEALGRQKNVRLVAISEQISAREKDIAYLSKLTGADEILRSELACKISECALILSLIRQDKTLVWRDTLRIPTTNLLFIGDYVQKFWLDFHHSAQEKDVAIHARSSLQTKEYRGLLILRESYQNRELTEAQYLQQLMLFGCRYLVSCRELIRLYKRQFHQQRQLLWLDKADALIAKANLGYSARFLQVDKIYLALLRRDFTLADRLISALEGVFYTDDLVLALRARWYFEQGFYLKGKSLMIKLVQQRPSAINRFNYALMLFRLGEYHASKNILEALAKDVPEYRPAQELLADTAFILGQWQQSSDLYKALLSSNARNPANLSNLGLSLLMQGQIKQAEKYFIEATKFAPDNPAMLLNLADVYWLDNKQQLSLGLYLKIIELFHIQLPRNLEEHLVLAQAYARLKQQTQAHTALLPVLQKVGIDPLLSFHIALVYLLLDEPDICLDYLYQARSAGLAAGWLQSPWLKPLTNDKRFTQLLSSVELE